MDIELNGRTHQCARITKSGDEFHCEDLSYNTKASFNPGDVDALSGSGTIEYETDDDVAFPMNEVYCGSLWTFGNTVMCQVKDEDHETRKQGFSWDRIRTIR